MGHAPARPRTDKQRRRRWRARSPDQGLRLPTRMEALKSDYIAGRISVQTLERAAMLLLLLGVADDKAPYSIHRGWDWWAPDVPIRPQPDTLSSIPS